jgi:hypothetical protein
MPGRKLRRTKRLGNLRLAGHGTRGQESGVSQGCLSLRETFFRGAKGEITHGTAFPSPAAARASRRRCRPR